MTLRDILRNKGTAVYTTTPDATLRDVVERLMQFNCGSLVVVESAGSRRMLGIITERDILKASAARRAPLDEVTVGASMSTNVVAASQDDPVPVIMGLMTKNRFRHMPVIEDGELVGIISIGDVVKAQHDALTTENHYLKTYITGEAAEAR